jgi:hypothetical protein
MVNSTCRALSYKLQLRVNQQFKKQAILVFDSFGAF